MWRFLTDIHLTLKLKAQKFQKLEGFQWEDLSKTFLVSKFEMNRPNIKLIITFCAILHLVRVTGSTRVYGVTALSHCPEFSLSVSRNLVFHCCYC